LPAHRFSTHSLRIAAATTARAADIQDATAQRAGGGWASLSSCLLYQLTSQPEHGRLYDALANPDHFTIQDVRALADRAGQPLF
jgi:hypothetical protein